MCGFLGAGKSTYSKKLAQKTDAIHLETDAWCMKLFSPQEYEQDWDACFAKTVEYLWDKAAQMGKQGKSVIFDMGFWTKQSRKHAIKKATRLGFVPKIYFIYAPDKILKERITKRGGVLADYNLKNFEKFKQHFQRPHFPEKYIKIKNY